MGYDCHIMPLIDVETKECIEHVSEQEEEGMKGNEPLHKGSLLGGQISPTQVRILLRFHQKIMNIQIQEYYGA